MLSMGHLPPAKAVYRLVASPALTDWYDKITATLGCPGRHRQVLGAGLKPEVRRPAFLQCTYLGSQFNKS
jgi:hypothetical protein